MAWVHGVCCVHFISQRIEAQVQVQVQVQEMAADREAAVVQAVEADQELETDRDIS